jgi:aryl-alcohol dehydrogenase-like predicted oxidoreductase
LSGVQLIGFDPKAAAEPDTSVRQPEFRWDWRRRGEARQQGFVGMSGTFPNLRDHIAMGVFDVFQIPYSAVEREHEDAITRAAEAGAGIVVRGGAAKGAPSEGKQTGLQ